MASYGFTIEGGILIQGNINQGSTDLPSVLVNNLQNHADPAPQRQRAITPILLRGMYTLVVGWDFQVMHVLTPTAIAVDLAIVGLFYAMC